MTDKLIVGIGEILWDILPESKKLGGAPANFAYHAAQSGLPSCVVSAVGNDLLGQEILENLENKKLNYQIAITPYPTGTVKVTVDNKGIPCYDICEQVAWDNIPYKSSLQELAKRTNAVCFGSLAQRNPVSRTTIQRFLNEMPEGENQYKIFDMNLRQSYYTREILHHSLRQCNVLKLNDEELTCVQQLFGYPHLRPETACKNLLATYSLKNAHSHLRHSRQLRLYSHKNLFSQNAFCTGLRHSRSRRFFYSHLLCHSFKRRRY